MALNETFSPNTEQQDGSSAWGEDYLKSVPEFAGERKFINLEEIMNLCDFNNTMICGHGTASSGDGHETVESIFDEGVKGYESLGSLIDEGRSDKVVGSTDLTDNVVGLWSSMEGEPNFQTIKETLDDWPHRKSRNVILMRFPLAYYHTYTEVSEERTQAYFTEHKDKNGQPTNYIDRRFIIGNYDAQTGKVELNPHFEPNISGDFEKELEERFKKVREQTKRRHEALDKNDASEPIDDNIGDDKPEKEGKLENNVGDTLPEWDWDDDW